MSSGHKTMTGFVAIICTLLVVIVGLSTDWPLWAWPAAIAVLAGATALAVKFSGPPDTHFPPTTRLEPDLPIPPPERWEQLVTQVALPSAMPDYDFQFSALVQWKPVDTPSDAPPINEAGIAIESILERARAITVQQSPERCALAQYRLNGALGTMKPDPSGRLTAMAEGVALTLTEADRNRLEKLATVRKDEDVWEHERKYERNKRAYLGDDVLKDTGSAVVWWMANHDDQIEKTVDLIGPLAQLSSAANNTEIDETFRHLVPGARLPQEPTGLWDGMRIVSEPEYLDDRGQTDGSGEAHGDGFAFSDEPPEPDITTVLGDLIKQAGFDEGSAETALFSRRVADGLAAAGRPDLSEQIRDRFDAPEPPDDEDPDR
ncbi:hypothetical protein AB0I82_20805 [Streptomyces sp. NPDC050315]|uniref:hypothetical protein n=1 Tax=Streptomyces sp. NPDC050315 TaxID=3155039 RepID=UPI00343AA161